MSEVCLREGRMYVTVAVILKHLQEASGWEDGELLQSVWARLSVEQLAGLGRLQMQVGFRGGYPGLGRARVIQHDVLLGEVQQRLHPDLTRQQMEHMFAAWRVADIVEIGVE